MTFAPHLIEGNWFLSKNGSLCRLDALPKNGEWFAVVTSGFTKNQLKIPAQEITFFTPTNPPTDKKNEEDEKLKAKIAERLRLKEDKNAKKAVEKAAKKVEKQLQKEADGVSVNAPKQPKPVKDDNTFYQKYPHVIHNSIYFDTEVNKKKCKIKCTKCGNERSIKVQDAFIVKLCLDCKNAK